MEHNLTVHVELWRKWFEYGKKIPEKDVKMGPPQERLPERKDETLASGARLQISLKERGGTHEVQIEGNRKGLQALAAICSGLAELTQNNCSHLRTITI
jgi:hypothetical protein